MRKLPIPAVNSVTFRSFDPTEVLSFLKQVGVPAIEWSGDTHVPPNDLKTAARVRELSKEWGITVAGYGSYHQCDQKGAGNGPFQFDCGAEAVLSTAQALGSPGVRVWAGRLASNAASTAYREEVATCLRTLCMEAEQMGITVHLEYHRNTLTDTPGSTRSLLDLVDNKNLRCYWQPRHGVSDQECLGDLKLLGPKLSHLHVFHWQWRDSKPVRLSLCEGRSRWDQFLKAAAFPGETRYAMIEFVKGDSSSQFEEDWKVLTELLEW